MNSLRWYLRHCWHRKPWKWLKDGVDARCHLCGYRVKGAAHSVCDNCAGTRWDDGAPCEVCS